LKDNFSNLNKISIMINIANYPESLPVEIEFGSPLADCKWHGICSTMAVSPEAWEAFVPQRLRRVKALLLKDTDNTIKLLFPAAGMLPATHRRFFPPEGFKFDAPAILSAPITDWLGMRAAIIPKGIVPIAAVSGGYQLVLEVATRRTSSFSDLNWFLIVANPKLIVNLPRI
jgi:hypothetical protein